MEKVKDLSSQNTKQPQQQQKQTEKKTTTTSSRIVNFKSTTLKYYNRGKKKLLSLNYVNLLICFIYIFIIKCFVQYTIIYAYFDQYKQFYVINDYSQWILQRYFAVISFISFFSLKIQVICILGRNGILPINTYIKELLEVKKKGFWSHPSIFFFFPPDSIHDWQLKGLCSLGMLLSTFYFMDIVPTVNILLLYIIFLSFKNVGREFFQLQFDNLLCEVYVLSLLTPPFRFIPFLPIYTSKFYQLSIWGLYFWLSVRLFVASGICKLTSEDPNWRNGTALLYHYWSQPMPMWTSYIFNYLPPSINRLNCYFHFIIEIGSPLILINVHDNLLANFNVISLVSLQIIIFISGNYGVFNLLSIHIALSVLNDHAVPMVIASFLKDRIYVNSTVANTNLIWEVGWDSITLIILIFYFTLSYVPLSQLSRFRARYNETLIQIYMIVSKFGLFNYYGLFGSMTTTRKEIIFEGSIDGKLWCQYEFRWKPGDVDRRPEFIIGHLPRLEWRLWFCQFQSFNFSGEYWLDSFIEKILLNEPDTVSVFLRNPFQIEPPKFIRCLIVPYKFSVHTPIDYYYQRLKARITPSRVQQMIELGMELGTMSKEEALKQSSPSQSSVLSKTKEVGRWWTRINPKLYYPIMTLDPKTNKLMYLVDK